MNEKEYEKFLGDVGKEISVLVAKKWSLAMSRFHDQCAKFCEKEDAYLEAVGKAQREAERNPQLRDYKDGTPPKDGWEWVDFFSTTRFWSEPLPFSPDAWVSNYYGPSVLSLFGFDDEAKEPDREDIIMCEYVVLGVIHDEFIKVPVSDRLCSIDDDEWRKDTWNRLQLRNSRVVFEQGERVRARLEKALENVKSDLSPAETGQKTKSIIVAIVISLIVILLFELLIYIVPITWIRNHPHTYGIQGSIICLILCLIFGFLKPQWRKWCWGTAAIAFLVGLLSLL